MDHLDRLPLAVALGAGIGTFLHHLAPLPAWRTRFGWLRPVRWGAGLGAAAGVVVCTPFLRHGAWVVLVDHPWWIDAAVVALGAAAIPFLVASIRRWEREHPEHTQP
ncbi:hypothetical protein ACIRST_38490 [Kitasatospora sp. NPDC101447]|uniref:hypothetical protein n=1 Tax=Kitasatospora sp. NPDC101447 TaxID=3364102 RepID=UPI0038098A9F